MKKIFCLLLTAAFLLMLGGCSNSEEKNAVLPPCRIGEGTSKASFGKEYTFETAFADADAVARIKVGDWLAEDEEIMSSYYEATVLQCFKGDMPGTFTLLQDGYSGSTLKGYPLFTFGEEMLVFLNRCVDGTEMKYNSPYWIMGAFTTLLDVAYDDDGNRYYVDPIGAFGERTAISKNYSNDTEIHKSVFSWICSADPLMAKAEGYRLPYIFSESDVLELINKQVN